MMLINSSQDTKTSIGKRIYQWRKETIERSFAEAKQNHGLRFARMLGLQNMYEQSFLTAAVQNMKRLAKACFFPFSFFEKLKALISLLEIRAFVDGLSPRVGGRP